MKELSLILVNEIETFGKGNCQALSGRSGPMPPGLIGMPLPRDSKLQILSSRVIY
jgi:hypothetical protein